MRVRSRAVDHVVDVRRSADGARVVVDGTVFDVDVRAVSPGSFVLRRENAVETFHCVRAGREIHLFWRGVAYRLQEVDEESAAARRAHAGALEAPMPGKILAVRVAVGDRVSRGAEIVILEAMKMENAVRAPRDGVVKSVGVTVGESVTAGHCLAELE